MKHFIKVTVLTACVLFGLLLLLAFYDEAIITTLDNSTAAIEAWDAEAAGRKTGESVDQFMVDLTLTLRSPEKALNEWGLALHENVVNFIGLGDN